MSDCASCPLAPDASDRGASSGDDLPAHAVGDVLRAAAAQEAALGVGASSPICSWAASWAVRGILVMIADERRRTRAPISPAARATSSFVLAAACPAVLITHLGRPERFLHMLRIVKFKSAMSMGVWGLVAFGASPATLRRRRRLARDGLLPRWIARSVAARASTERSRRCSARSSPATRAC